MKKKESNNRPENAVKPPPPPPPPPTRLIREDGNNMPRKRVVGKEDPVDYSKMPGSPTSFIGLTLGEVSEESTIEDRFNKLTEAFGYVLNSLSATIAAGRKLEDRIARLEKELLNKQM